ncbi:MAG: YerC/YecD family TrpR-related protein [Halanaerobiaceae bacterium]
MSRSIRGKFTDRLFDAILKLESREDCYRFFKDIATVGEIKALGQRLEVAKMLTQDKTYEEIAEKTGVSSATISRVKKALYYGEDGYKLILEKMGYDLEE